MRFKVCGMASIRSANRTLKAWERVHHVLKAARNTVGDPHMMSTSVEQEEMDCFDFARQLRQMLNDAESQTERMQEQASGVVDMLERWNECLEPHQMSQLSRISSTASSGGAVLSTAKKKSPATRPKPVPAQQGAAPEHFVSGGSLEVHHARQAGENRNAAKSVTRMLDPEQAASATPESTAVDASSAGGMDMSSNKASPPSTGTSQAQLSSSSPSPLPSASLSPSLQPGPGVPLRKPRPRRQRSARRLRTVGRKSLPTVEEGDQEGEESPVVVAFGDDEA